MSTTGSFLSYVFLKFDVLKVEVKINVDLRSPFGFLSWNNFASTIQEK